MIKSRIGKFRRMMENGYLKDEIQSPEYRNAS
jgi:hypothetical protein